ncbi:MAG: tyrosine-type recombinase/integrase [Bacteroidota bacterium]
MSKKKSKGSIRYDKKRERWRLSYVNPITGKRRQPTFGTKEEAEEALVEIRYNILRKKQPDLYSEILTTDWFEGYLYNLPKKYSNYETLKKYRPIIQSFIDYLQGHFKYKHYFLNEVTKKVIVDYRDHIEKMGKKTNTINSYLAGISGGFQEAIEHEIINKNPVRQVKKVKEKSTQFQIFEKEEREKILEYMHSRNPYFSDVFTVYFNTGMRRNELRFLFKSDYVKTKEGSNIIVIKEKILPDGKRWSPKWKKERTIPVVPKVQKIIEKYLKKDKDSPFLFPHVDGKPMLPDVPRRHLMRALKNTEIEVKGRTLHTTRHTFISELANKPGVSIPAVMEIAGHNNIETTQIYIHTSDQNKEHAMSNLSL